MIQRVLTTIFLLVGVFVMPWWLLAAMSFLVAISYVRYFEILFIAMAADLVYGIPDTLMRAGDFFPFQYTIYSIGFLVVASFIGNRLRN